MSLVDGHIKETTKCRAQFLEELIHNSLSELMADWRLVEVREGTKTIWTLERDPTAEEPKPCEHNPDEPWRDAWNNGWRYYCQDCGIEGFSSESLAVNIQWKTRS